ncbi:unnamed protein product [Effrenium voratum]|nr:unnamed protein product [Effrenium voratum]
MRRKWWWHTSTTRRVTTRTATRKSTSFAASRYGPHERRVHHSRGGWQGQGSVGGRKKRDVQREDRDVRLPKAPMLPCRVGMARNGQLSGFHFF